MCLSVFKIFILVLCILTNETIAIDNLKVAFQWKQLDFRFDSAEDREKAIESGSFVPENNLPLGLEVYRDRVFLTVPRWKKGVAASLAYIRLNDSMDSPKLNPYPNWSAHSLTESAQDSNPPEIVSPFRVRADQCGRLWVLDTGLADILEESKRLVSKPQVIIYDLHNDVLLRRFPLPDDQMTENSFFANIAVEDDDCSNTFGYFADLGSPGLIVYSFKDNESWKITHHYFHIDPLAGEMSVNGINFEWTDGVFGLALSGQDLDGFSTLYFHPMTSTNEFSVNTKYLRDKNLKSDEIFNQFKLLGNRGPKSQSGTSFFDKKSNILFYTLLNLNAIACWRTKSYKTGEDLPYTMQSQGRIYMNNVTMVFPNDLKVDFDGNLWALSDRLPMFMYSKLNPDEYNYRILTGPVEEAIRDTTCDAKIGMEAKKSKNDTKNVKSSVSSSIVYSSVKVTYILPFVMLFFVRNNL